MMLHITCPGSCWLLLLTALLYVPIAARLLRRHHAGNVGSPCTLFKQHASTEESRSLGKVTLNGGAIMP
jgi:hypothetical protein